MLTTRQEAYFGGGCFWCLEAVYQNIRGVVEVTSGYMGGWVANPSYEQVCGKATGHAEVVRVVFEPAQIRYADLLAVFFSIHDPTTVDRQGNDIGPQYRSIIFAADAFQSRQARESLRLISGQASEQDALPDEDLVRALEGIAFPRRVVTQIVDVPADIPVADRDVAHRFWPAESEHHDYFRRHPDQGYCAFVVAPKVDKARRNFAALMRET